MALVSNIGMDGSFVHGFSRDWSPQPGTGIREGGWDGHHSQVQADIRKVRLEKVEYEWIAAR